MNAAAHVPGKAGPHFLCTRELSTGNAAYQVQGVFELPWLKIFSKLRLGKMIRSLKYGFPISQDLLLLGPYVREARG